jgi:hypothetical protein
LTAEDIQRLQHENEFLKARCAKLQGEVWDLSGRLARSHRLLEQVPAQAVTSAPAPLPAGDGGPPAKPV